MTAQDQIGRDIRLADAEAHQEPDHYCVPCHTWFPGDSTNHEDH